MSLVPTWILRVHVPLGRSRRRPMAGLDAVLRVVREHPSAGRLGAYDDVSELSLGREHFRAGEAASRGTTAVVTTYLQRVSRQDVEALADAIAAVHPWEHPVIEIVGPEGAFLWAPAERAAAT